MKWATRAGVHVDRTACAWLIRRFIDEHAEFVFVQPPDEVPADATPFDMRGVELSHHGGACTFETMLTHYGLDDEALWDIARIVHEADAGRRRPAGLVRSETYGCRRNRAVSSTFSASEPPR